MRPIGRSGRDKGSVRCRGRRSGRGLIGQTGHEIPGLTKECLHESRLRLSIRPLALYTNDRLISLRKTRLVKVAEEGGRATYRLLGIPHVSSAKATFTFVVNGPGGGVSTTWRRG